MSMGNALPGSTMRSAPRRERLRSSTAHHCKDGDLVSKSTDWRPYVVVGASVLSLEIERMKFRRAIATRIAMTLRRNQWASLDGIGQAADT